MLSSLASFSASYPKQSTNLTESACHRRKLRVEYMKSKRNRTNSINDSISISCSEDFIPPQKQVDNCEVDIKKSLRKIRNRESAEASRKRKRDDVVILQRELEILSDQVRALKCRLSRYESSDIIREILEHPEESLKLSNNTLVYTEPAVFNIHISLRRSPPSPH